MKTTLLACALVFATANASAQMIYVSVNEDGHKTYSDQPDVLPNPVPAVAPRPSPAGTMARGSRGAVQVNTNEAQRRLVQAQLNREQGIAPLPGERTRNPDGVTYRYWRRQEALRLQVEQAQRRVNATRQPQLAGR